MVRSKKIRQLFIRNIADILEEFEIGPGDIVIVRGKLGLYAIGVHLGFHARYHRVDGVG